MIWKGVKCNSNYVIEDNLKKALVESINLYRRCIIWTAILIITAGLILTTSIIGTRASIPVVIVKRKIIPVLSKGAMFFGFTFGKAGIISRISWLVGNRSMKFDFLANRRIIFTDNKRDSFFDRTISYTIFNNLMLIKRKMNIFKNNKSILSNKTGYCTYIIDGRKSKSQFQWKQV